MSLCYKRMLYVLVLTRACRAGARLLKRWHVLWIRFKIRHRYLQDWPIKAVHGVKCRRVQKICLSRELKDSAEGLEPPAVTLRNLRQEAEGSALDLCLEVEGSGARSWRVCADSRKAVAEEYVPRASRGLPKGAAESLWEQSQGSSAETFSPLGLLLYHVDSSPH